MIETKESFLEYWEFLPVDKQLGIVKETVKCNDGFTFSARFTFYEKIHYGMNYGMNCNSKEADRIKEITHMELGYPSEADDLIAPYANEKEYGTPLTQDVYGYTPIDVIVALVNKHGGLKK